MSVNWYYTRDGRRWSAARAYLYPAMGRPGLTLRTEALVHRVVLEQRRAVGVEYSVRGARQLALADSEVIVAGEPGIERLPGAKA